MCIVTEITKEESDDGNDNMLDHIDLSKSSIIFEGDGTGRTINGEN